MSYVLLGLAVFGLITSTVFAGMVLAAVPRYLRERQAAELSFGSGRGLRRR